jgi:hypothetical protein
MVRWCLLAIVLALPGCTTVLGIGEPGLSGGAPDGGPSGDAAVTSDAPAGPDAFPGAVDAAVIDAVLPDAPMCGASGAIVNVMTDQGTMIPAFRRGDGAILLAHFGPGTRHTSFDLANPQIASVSGGGTPPGGWAPDPCVESGHLAFAPWNPAGKQLILECGESYEGSVFSVASSSLFADFSSGTKGTYGASGNPGWGMIAATNSGAGRSNHGSCGGVQDETGGIAYCSGTASAGSFANHLVSFYTTANPITPFVGCNHAGCSGPTCNLHVWIWLKP